MVTYGSIQLHFVFLRPETGSNFTYEYSGAYRACSVTNRKGRPVGRPDDHHALLLSALAWRGVPRYIHVHTHYFFINKKINKKRTLTQIIGRYGTDVVVVVRSIPDRPAINWPGP